MPDPEAWRGRAEPLPAPGEDIPDPARRGRRGTGDPDTRDAWPEHDDVVATGRDDRRTHVVDPDLSGRARCGAPVAGITPGATVDCPDCAAYP